MADPFRFAELDILIGTILAIFILITSCFYAITKTALYNMYVAYLNCEVFWKYEANESEMEKEVLKAGRLLRHANWWKSLFEKNCLVVRNCFYSLFSMVITFLIVLFLEK